MVYLLIGAVFYAIAILLGTVASRHLNTNLSAGVMNLISSVIPIAVAAPLLTRKLVSEQDEKFGLLMAVLGGICVAIFAMALTKSYSENKVGIVAPVIFGGALFLSTGLSMVFLKEKVTLLQGIGLLILGIGLAIITYARATGK